MTCTYQLVFGDAILESDNMKELKDFVKEMIVYWEIHKIYRSDLNQYKFKRLSVSEAREVIKLRDKNWTCTGLAERFNCSKTRMDQMIKSLNI